MEETRRYNKDYLIRKMKNGGDYVRFYSYRACTVITSQELKNGVPVRVVAMRKSDCAKYLTKDEISGIAQRRKPESGADGECQYGILLSAAEGGIRKSESPGLNISYDATENRKMLLNSSQIVCKI